MTLVRDPRNLYARHGRQLLVEGVDFDGQQNLFRLGASFAAAAGLEPAAEAAARYLVGAGLGRAVAPAPWSACLAQMDPEVQVFDTPDRLAAPAVHIHLVPRPWGAAADLIWLTADQPPRVASVHWKGPAPCRGPDALALGCSVAAIVVDTFLGLASWPAVVEIDVQSADAPAVRTVSAGCAAGAHGDIGAAEPGPSWQADPQVAAVIAEHAAQAYPLEACGWVVQDASGRTQVWPEANLQDRLHSADPEHFPRTSRTAFALDSRSVARAEAQGLHVVGIWHSHADAPAQLSAADVEAAVVGGEPLHPGVAWGVVSVLAGRPATLRWLAWRQGLWIETAVLECSEAAR